MKIGSLVHGLTSFVTLLISTFRKACFVVYKSISIFQLLTDFNAENKHHIKSLLYEYEFFCIFMNYIFCTKVVPQKTEGRNCTIQKLCPIPGYTFGLNIIGFCLITCTLYILIQKKMYMKF